MTVRCDRCVTIHSVKQPIKAVISAQSHDACGRCGSLGIPNCVKLCQQEQTIHSISELIKERVNEWNCLFQRYRDEIPAGHDINGVSTVLAASWLQTYSEAQQ